MSELGYGEYRAVFADRNGLRLGEVSARLAPSVSWGRVTSDVSQCDLEIGTGSAALRNLEPWLHQVALYRNAETVWRGIVYGTTASAAGVTVTARDPSVYFDRRRIKNRHVWFQRDLADIARDLVVDAMAGDDLFSLAARMAVAPTGIYATRDVKADERMLAEELGDLVDAGLTWTVLGGRLLIGPVAAEYRTAPISDRDVDASFAVTKDGGDTVTDALILGKGVQATFADTTSPLGLLQVIEKQDALSSGYQVQNAARRLVRARSITPRRLSLPADTQLLPTAPVGLDELVCGAEMPVKTTVTGIEINARMRIGGVSVSVSAGEEKVAVSLMDVPEEPTPQELIAPPSGYATADDNQTFGG